MKVGMVGLGKMGAGMAQNALRIGLKVAGVDTHPVSDALKHDGIQVAADEKDGPKDTDMTAQLTKIKGPGVDGIEDPDVACAIRARAGALAPVVVALRAAAERIARRDP